MALTRSSLCQANKISQSCLLRNDTEGKYHFCHFERREKSYTSYINANA